MGKIVFVLLSFIVSLASAQSGYIPYRAKALFYDTVLMTKQLKVNSTAGAIIGGYNKDASAILELSSTTKGLLLPRLTTAQMNAIASPIAGLVIYNTDSAKQCTYSTSWTCSASGGGGDNIYNTDGTLTSDRTLTQNGNDLTFSSGNFSLNSLPSLSALGMQYVDTLTESTIVTTYDAGSGYSSSSMVSVDLATNNESSVGANFDAASLGFLDFATDSVRKVLIEAHVDGAHVDGNKNDGSNNLYLNGWTGSTEVPLFHFYNNGEAQFHLYPNTRVDSASPVNFLYTDTGGHLKSGAISNLSSGWSLTGNSGTAGDGTNYIGTSDAQPLFIKYNNATTGEQIKIDLTQTTINNDNRQLTARDGITALFEADNGSDLTTIHTTNLTYAGSAHSAGDVLTSDGTGIATWQPATNSSYSVYTALLTETAPATNTGGALIVGETYTIDTYVSGDDFANVATVVSGTINTTGCVFLATGENPTDWSNGSSLTNSGAPVATVLQNTMGGAVTYTYNSVGTYHVSLPVSLGATNLNTFTSIGQVAAFLGGTVAADGATNTVIIYTIDSMGVGQDGILGATSPTSIEIRVY